MTAWHTPELGPPTADQWIPGKLTVRVQQSGRVALTYSMPQFLPSASALDSVLLGAVASGLQETLRSGPVPLGTVIIADWKPAAQFGSALYVPPKSRKLDASTSKEAAMLIAMMAADSSC